MMISYYTVNSDYGFQLKRPDENYKEKYLYTGFYYTVFIIQFYHLLS